MILNKTMRNPRTYASFCALLALFVLMLSFVLGGCASSSPPSAARNDPPSEIFSNFHSFTLVPVTASDPSIPTGVVQRIQEHIDDQLQPMLDSWNKTGAAKGAATAQTLIIAPVITKAKYVTGAQRFFLGPMSGSTTLTMQVTFTQKETGKAIGSALFFAKGSAWAPSMTFGSKDRAALLDIVTHLKNYMIQNYTTLNGGAL